MRTIELFSGTGSFSKAAYCLGHETFTIDNDIQHKADLYKDVLDLDPKMPIFKDINILWASPPCQGFSVAAIGSSWCGDYHPKRSQVAIGMALVLKTIELIREIKPKYWFIENPRGVLRKMAFMDGLHRKTVTYCQYGDTRMKPTDIWTNLESWTPRPMCKNGDRCHTPAPRGSKTPGSTQGIKGAKERGVIPNELFREIFEEIERVEKGESRETNKEKETTK